MIRVIYMVEEFGTGGLEKCVVELVNGVDQTIFKPMVCCLRRSGAMERRITRKDVEIFEMHKQEGNDLRLPFRLAKLFKEKEVHIVHSANWGTYAESTIAAQLARVPAHVHMEQGMEFNEYHEGDSLKKRLRHLTQRLLNPFVDKVVAVSEEIRIRYIKTVGIAAEKTTTIPNCVDVDTYKPDPLRRKRKRKELGLVDDELAIGSIGRLVKIKNYSLLIRAFSVVKREHPAAKLFLVGNGEQRPELEQLVSHLGLAASVRLLGERDDTMELLTALDIFVLPSFFEGVSISILEAMSAGLPVIASNVGGNPELLIGEESGLLFDSENLEQLSDAISKCLKNGELRTRLASNARKRVKQFFSTTKLVQSYTNLYLDCLGRNGFKH